MIDVPEELADTQEEINGEAGRRFIADLPHLTAAFLDRWGLRLDAPEQRGPRQAAIGGQAVLTASPGTLVALGRECDLAGAALVARCRIGRGEAIVIADADLLNVGSEGRDDGNLAALVSQLESLTR